MRNSGAFLAIVVSITFAALHAAASMPVSKSSDSKKISEPATQAPLFKNSPAPASAPANPSHTFAVNDEKGLLLTCIAPEIETNPDTDTFNGCSLAAGRTLDDVMHTFIGAIHHEQNEQLKERADWARDLEERSAQKPAQK